MLVKMSVQTKSVLHVPLQCFFSVSPLFRSLPPSLAVLRAAVLVPVAAQREGGFALWLGHLAGQVDEGLDERAPVSH